MAPPARSRSWGRMGIGGTAPARLRDPLASSARRWTSVQQEGVMDPKSPASRPPQIAPARRRRSLFGELYRGAVLGDFALDKGLLGVLTQIVVGYLPIAGTLGALRDAL